MLLSRYDVFLLDEPTNDLDFAGLERLEQFVLGLQAGLVVVSHDREFLARTVDAVLDIDGPLRTARLYGGGWESYLQERARARSQHREAYEEYEDKRTGLVQQAQRQREQSVRGALRAKRKVPDNDRVGAGAQDRGGDARGRPGEDDRGADRPARRGRRAAQGVAAAAAASRPPPAPARSSPRCRARWSSAAASGSGRSRCRCPPATGWRSSAATAPARRPCSAPCSAASRWRRAAPRWAPACGVGEVDQARSRFTGERTVVEVVEQATGWPASECRTLLAKFGLRADHTARPAASLSPGERTRAGLALLQAVGVNCLVLDEPTNHLDVPAIEQLEAALEAYDGTLLLVTHDRRLLQEVRTTRTLEVADGQVRER